jgi:thiamine-phosphate pyrophosphorylase
MTRQPAPRLIIITDTLRAPAEVWLERLEALCAAAAPGSVWVQLRDRSLPVRERRRFGERLRELSARYGQGLAVNDRLDLAILLEADGVHLGETSVLAEDARAYARMHGKEWLVSAACHDVQRVSLATADALLLSPVAAPRKGKPALGAEGVREAVRARGERSSALLYALGGVTRDNARQWLDAGADGVALIGELLASGADRDLPRALAIAR